MAMSYPLKVRLKMVRFSYPHVFKPKGFGKKNEGTPKFSITGIIDPDTKTGQANIAAMEEAIDAAAKEKWPKDWQKNLKKMRKDNRVCLREGDDDDEASEGMMIVAASNEEKPLALDENGDDVTAADNVIYAGAYGDIIVRVWAQDNDYGLRINASLEGVKFRRDGDPLSSVSRASREDFDDDDDDDEPKRGRSSSRGRGRDDDDDDDEPKRGRSSSRGRSRDDDDDDDESKRGRSSSRGRSRDDDDEDDEPKRGRSSSRGRSRDDDDEDDEPKRGRSSSRGRGRDDDDDEPKSRSRSRSRSRDDDDDY